MTHYRQNYRQLCLDNSSQQVAQGRGRNIIPPPKERPLWMGFLEKFRDPLIIVLLVVFLFSVGVALYEIHFAGASWSTMIEPLGVLMALLLATGVGFIFEVRAEREFKILNKKKDERKVKVLRWMDSAPRHGDRPQMLLVKKSDVVVGDIVRLESGDEVPADGTLVRADSLLVDESAFTGEMYAAKTLTATEGDEETAYPHDFLLRGSIVLEGQCLYQVTAVGMDTEEGRGAKLIQEESTVKTPLNQQLDSLGLWITRASYLIALLIVAGRLVYYFFLDGNNSNNTDLLEIVTFTLNSIMIAVTLIVVAVPEGLPMSVTMSLALSMKRMLKENNLVRKLHACETMGAATVICTDKTGTLTKNKLRVMEDSEALYVGIEEIARCIALNSTAELSIQPSTPSAIAPSSCPSSRSSASPSSRSSASPSSCSSSRPSSCSSSHPSSCSSSCSSSRPSASPSNPSSPSPSSPSIPSSSPSAVPSSSPSASVVYAAVSQPPAPPPPAILRTVGNPTEGSLLYWLKKRKNLDYQDFREAMTVTRQISFTPESKHMTTFATDNATGRRYRFVKGAPEIVLDLCDEIAAGKTRKEVLDSLAAMQRIGRRTLAFAQQEIIEGKSTPLTFIGFVGMADPIREDVRQAVDTCHKAGVNIIMVTGDVALTANEVARQTGIIEPDSPTQVITGAEFEQMTDDEIKTRLLPSLKVLSRARPADKARLVTLLQETGQVVAVTGDGTNDAPALKKAQVGLSMGDGTARAKEASDITIIDNSFASINTAILWGRSLYQNIRRFILFQMTINICACLIVLFGAFMGLDSPLNVTQMLWVNLIMDTFAAMALSSLPPDPGVMLDKPRKPGSHIIDGPMATRIVGVGMLLFVFLFGLWQLLWHSDIRHVSDLCSLDIWKVYFSSFLDFSKSKQHLNPYELGVFFTFFVLLQFWNLFNARYFKTTRSLTEDIWDSLHTERVATTASAGEDEEDELPEPPKHFSWGFIFILVVILLGQVLIVNVFGEMFGVAPLSASDWLLLLLFSFPILLVGELIRLLWNRR